MFWLYLWLDGQPPKYKNTQNQKAINESSGVQSHPIVAAKSPSPPLRKSSIIKTESQSSNNANSKSNMKENNSIEGDEAAGILFCEDYAEIVENEEGDYSRYTFFL